MIQKIFIALALVTLAGCATEVADRTGEPGGDDMTDGARSNADAAPEAAADPAAPVDMFAGDMPDLLLEAHVRQLDGETFGLSTLQALYDYAKEHGSDARPWLLLARDSMRNKWVGMAVRQYRSAIAADRRAAEQEGVYEDLLQIASDYEGVEHREAIEILSSVYGVPWW
jgi:hypothetical protein